jgi:hypothetical protein
LVRYNAPASAGKKLVPARQRLQREAQQLAQGSGNSLPVAGLAVLESAITLHQIKRRAVDLDRINRAAPRWRRSRQRAVSAARRCLKAAVFSTIVHPVSVSAVAHVTTYLFPSRATPICSQAAVIADRRPLGEVRFSGDLTIAIVLGET